MGNKELRNKIIWALDPTQGPADLKNVIAELKTWQNNLGCDIQPVSIFFQPNEGLSLEIPFSWEPEFVEAARESLKHYLQKIRGVEFVEPKLIFMSSLSTRKMAVAMARYAEKEKALFILANTHTRKKMNPFRLGGFAETLVATSKLPVLLLNPTARPSNHISSVLFPTDFSEESRGALLSLTPWLKELGAKVLLFNQLESPYIYPILADGGFGTNFLVMESAMSDVEASRWQTGETWAKSLRELGIECKVIVQREVTSLSDDIIEIAKKNKVNLIAMATRTGPVARIILGSVARDVLLKALCPVLTFYRPKEDRKQIPKKKRNVGAKTGWPRESSAHF